MVYDITGRGIADWVLLILFWQFHSQPDSAEADENQAVLVSIAAGQGGGTLYRVAHQLVQNLPLTLI